MDRKYAHKPCPECKRYTNRAVTVNMIVVQDDKIFLILRGVEPYLGKWAVPGGYINWGETGEVGATREIFEEGKIVVTECVFLCVTTDPNRHPDQAINITYVATAFTGEPEAGDDAVQFMWWPLDKLSEISLAFDHHSIIAQYLEWKAKQVSKGGSSGHADPY